MRKHFYALIAGATFAYGLALSGMSRPSKVRGFLDFFGDWDMTLAFVLGPAVGIYVLGTYIAKRFKPTRFVACSNPERMDTRFFIGCIMFGVGWGMVGICPGPSLVMLGQSTLPATLFFAFMLLGIFLADRVLGRVFK